MQYIKLKVEIEGEDVFFYQCILNGYVIEHRVDPDGALFEIPPGVGGGEVVDPNPPWPIWGVEDPPPPPPPPVPLLTLEEVAAIRLLADLVQSGRLRDAVEAAIVQLENATQ